jgi:hypothetical protein
MPCHRPSPSPGRRALAAGAIALAVFAVAPQAVAARPADRTASASVSQDELSYVYFITSRAATMSGSVDDVARARKHRRPGEPMLWFRYNGREYVVRDPSLLRALDGMWARENGVDAERDAIAARQGVAGEQLGRLAARESRGVSAAERRTIGEQSAALDRELLDLSRKMEALDRRKEDASHDSGARVRAFVEQVIASGAAESVR